MKKKFIIFVVCLISLQTFTLVSCVQDDIYFYNDDLSISSHTPMTRNAMENEILPTPSFDDAEEANKKYTPYENSCALVAIMEDWIAKQVYGYFGSNCPENAQAHYDRLVLEFKRQNPNWTEGDPITDEQFLTFLSGSMSVERRFIDDAVTYFIDIQNRQNIVYVYLEKVSPEGRTGHYASVLKVENEHLVIRGQEIVPNNRIYFCGTGGWNIVGVVYNKPKQ